MGSFGLGGLHRASTWLFPVATVADLPPSAVDGAVVFVRATDELWEYNGATSSWIKIAPGSGGVGTHLSGMILITFDQELDNGTSGAAKHIDWYNGQKQFLQLTDNAAITFGSPLGAANLLLRLQQDGVGSWNPTWPANVKWPNGSPPNLSIGKARLPGAESIVSFYFNEVDYYGVPTLNFK